MLKVEGNSRNTMLNDECFMLRAAGKRMMKDESLRLRITAEDTMLMIKGWKTQHGNKRVNIQYNIEANASTNVNIGLKDECLMLREQPGI